MLLDNINKKLLSKTLLGIVIMFGLSFISFLFPESRTWLTLGVVIIFFIISLRSLEWGIYLIVLELLISVQGYILAFEFVEFSLSLRIAFFIIWLSLFSVKILFSEFQEFLAYIRQNWWIIIIPVFLILFGVIKGITTGSDFYAVFFDVNGFLFWLYALPFLYIGINKQKLLTGLAAGIIWIVSKSVILLYTFGHHFDKLNITLYHWLRDFRMIEVTEMNLVLYRIFFQNQIFLLLAFTILFVYLIKKLQTKKHYYTNLFLFTIVLLGIVISFSRSIWLGLVVVGIALLFLAFNKKTKSILDTNLSNIAKFSVVGIIFSFVLWLGIAFLPIPFVDLDNLAELNRFGLDAAATARIQMLRPMLDGIQQEFLFGHGFGKTLTYFTTDPRIVSMTAGGSGEYTTFAFEWGYFDIALKVGIIGLVVYFAFLLKFVLALFHKAKADKSSFILGLFLGLIGLLVVNITTPYLNHPLGIGFIIITLLLSGLYGKEKIAKI